MKLQYGDSAAREVSERIGHQVATLAILKQTPVDRRVDGQVFHVLADNTLWQWVDEAVAAGDDVLAATPDDAPSTGRFMRMPGGALLAMTFLATTPTGTNLLTVPSGSIVAPKEFGYRISRVFTGPANAALAVSSSNHPGHTGVGGFMGSMVATQLNNTGAAFQMSVVASGTFDTVANRRTWLKGGDTIRLDVIGANFGTGIGQVLLACDILQNPGH